MAGALAAQPVQACEVRVRAGDRPPYFVATAGGQTAGFHADLLREVFSRQKCTVQFLPLTWEEAMQGLEAGTVDVVAGAFATPERERFARFSTPINRSRNVLYLRRSAPGQRSVDRLDQLLDSTLAIAVGPGAAYSAEYTRLLGEPRFRARLQLFEDLREAWQALSAGRIDGVIADENTALWRTAALQWPLGANTRGIVLSDAPSHVAFSRATRDAAFVRRFDQALASTIADGTYARLRQRYIPCPVDPTTLGCRGG